jgi:hypothetical protein
LAGPTQVDQSDTRSFYGSFQAVRLLSQSALTLSGLQTVQGVALSAGDRVCASGQASAVDNGVYIVDSGAWYRSFDCEDGDEVGSMLLLVEDGDNANELWRVSGLTNATYVGTDAIEFEPYTKGNPSGYFSYATFFWNVNGALQAGNKLDGIRLTGFAGEIVGVDISVQERGNDGDTIIDINHHIPAGAPIAVGASAYGTAGSTIYTTQANRPKLTGDSANRNDNGIHRAVVPDITSFNAGEFFTIDIDSAAQRSQDLCVIMLVRYDN